MSLVVLSGEFFFCMSYMRMGSNVIEKCLEAATPAIKEAYLLELVTSPKLKLMLLDQFANYVVQRALGVCSETHGLLLVKAIVPHLAGMKNTSGGRRITARILKRFPTLVLDIPHTSGAGTAMLTSGSGYKGSGAHHHHHPQQRPRHHSHSSGSTSTSTYAPTTASTSTMGYPHHFLPPSHPHHPPSPYDAPSTPLGDYSTARMSPPSYHHPAPRLGRLRSASSGHSITTTAIPPRSHPSLRPRRESYTDRTASMDHTSQQVSHSSSPYDPSVPSSYYYP